MKIDDNPWFRIGLHARCILRRPLHVRFHVAGILREFSPGDAGVLVFALVTAYAATAMAVTISSIS